MPTSSDSQNQHQIYGGDDSSIQFPRQSVSCSPIQSPVKSPRRSPSLSLSDNLEHTHILVEIQDYVTLHPITSDIQEGITFFKYTLVPAKSKYGLPITCDWFTVSAKATYLRGWPRTIYPYAAWVKRVAAAESTL